MLGLIRTVTEQPTLAQQLDEHGVGAVAVRPELRAACPAGSSRSRVGDRLHDGRACRARSRSGCRASAASTISAGLGEVRRAGDVGQDAAGLQGGDRRIQQRGLQSREFGDVARLLAPARLRAAAQRAEARARRVEQDAVEPARASRSRTAGRRLRAPREPDRTPASALRTSRARVGTSSLATSGAPPSAASAASSAALPPGPAQRSSQRSPADDRPGAAERERGELRALVLHARPPARDDRVRRRVAARRACADRRDAARLADLGDASRGRAARPGSPRVPRCRRRAAARARRRGPRRRARRGRRATIQTGMRVLDREPVVAARGPPSARSRHSSGRRAGDRAQHAVGEARRRALARRCATSATDSSTAAWAATRIDEQLVGAEPQRVEHRGIELRRAAGRSRARSRGRSSRGGAACRRSSSVARPASAGASCASASSDRQQQVRVGVVLAHGAQHLVGDAAGRLHARSGALGEASVVIVRRPASPSRPRHQSAAAIARLPAGCTSRSSIGVVAVPTSTPSAALLDAARVERAATSWAMAAASTLSRAPSIVVNAPGSGVTPRMRASTRRRHPESSRSGRRRG